VLLGAKVPSLHGPAEGGLNLQALTYAFWEPFVAWGFIMGLLTFFQRRFAELSGLWPNLARRAFLIYIIHPPVLVGVAVAWHEVSAPALVKFLVTGSLACALCYLIADGRCVFPVSPGLFDGVNSCAPIAVNYP
jgi:hypothetical protein